MIGVSTYNLMTQFTDTLRISVDYNVLNMIWGVNVQSNDQNLQILLEFQLITMC